MSRKAEKGESGSCRCPKPVRNTQADPPSTREIIRDRKEETRLKFVNDMLHYAEKVFLCFRLEKGSATQSHNSFLSSC